MRKCCPSERLSLVAALTVLLAGCQQADQILPFQLAEGQAATGAIGPNGGTLTVPPSFSIEIPAGAVGGSVSVAVTPLTTQPYPDDAGTPVPGTAYDVQPIGTPLAVAATVELAVPASLLEAGDDVRLALAVEMADGSVRTFDGTYDLTNGVLVADIDVLGPIAAVIALDAVPIDLGDPPMLGGGSFPVPAPPAPVGGPFPSSHGGVEFSASCAPEIRQCFSSGLIRVWADDVVRSRLGDDLFLLNPRVEASLDFIAFDLAGVPTSVIGSLSIDGALRARLNSAVTSYELGDGITTGAGTQPEATTLQVSGNLMTIGQTTTTGGEVEFDEGVEFAIDGIGTSEMLLLRLEAEVLFKNADESETIGYIIAHLRLRR